MVKLYDEKKSISYCTCFFDKLNVACVNSGLNFTFENVILS